VVCRYVPIPPCGLTEPPAVRLAPPGISRRSHVPLVGLLRAPYHRHAYSGHLGHGPSFVQHTGLQQHQLAATNRDDRHVGGASDGRWQLFQPDAEPRHRLQPRCKRLRMRRGRRVGLRPRQHGTGGGAHMHRRQMGGRGRRTVLALRPTESGQLSRPIPRQYLPVHRHDARAAEPQGSDLWRHGPRATLARVRAVYRRRDRG
jgi:hypothetical protein